MAFTPLAGELVFDTDECAVFVGDGVTAGGKPISNLTNEQIEDIVGALIGDSSTIDITYDDAGNVLTMDVITSALNHQDLNGAGTNDHAAIDAHIASTANPHVVTITQAITADGGTDITVAELEQLTDNSDATGLHNHDSRYFTQGQITAQQAIQDLAITQNANDIVQNASDIAQEITDRTNADAGLQAQITANDGDIATNAANIATNAADIASNDTDIAANAAAIATNAANIASNDTDIANNAAAIATNAANIASNDTDIATNASDIATNAANIASNDTDIANNAAAIATNAANIASNDTDIATNAANIASNDTDIATNAAAIAANAANIASNDTDIATNASDIATNAADIAQEITDRTNADAALQAQITSNDTDIATNASDLAAHIADLGNPHATTFTQAVAADPGTDITASEAEILTDGSDASSQHNHDTLYRKEFWQGSQVTAQPNIINDDTVLEVTQNQISAASVFSYSGGELTINKASQFQFDVKVTGDTETGARETLQIKLQRNRAGGGFVDIPTTEAHTVGFSYHRNNASGEDTNTVGPLLTVLAGDIFRVVMICPTAPSVGPADGVTTVAAGTGILVKEF